MNKESELVSKATITYICPCCGYLIKKGKPQEIKNGKRICPKCDE